MLRGKGGARLINNAEVMRSGTGLATRSGTRRCKLDETLGYRSFCRIKPRLPITVRELQSTVYKVSTGKSKPYLAKH